MRLGDEPFNHGDSMGELYIIVYQMAYMIYTEQEKIKRS